MSKKKMPSKLLPKQKRLGKKKQVILSLYQKFGTNTEFSTSDLQEHSNKYGFKNHFDIPHINSREQLPKECSERGITIVNNLKGKYMFKEDMNNSFHKFEDIYPDECVDLDFEENITYGKNLTSEGDTINYCSMSGIYSHFFSGDFKNSSKVDLFLGGRRQYNGKQIEFDGILKIPHLNIISSIEAKNEKFLEFRVSQLIRPYEYLLKESGGSNNVCCLFIQKVSENNCHIIKIWQYKFNLESESNDIILIKKRQYNSFF